MEEKEPFAWIEHIDGSRTPIGGRWVLTDSGGCRADFDVQVDLAPGESLSLSTPPLVRIVKE